MPTAPLPIARALALSLALAGCATVHRAGPSVGFDPHPTREVSDDDIRAAFAARPQLGERSRVAYFSYDAARDGAIEGALASLPRVAGTYRIPARMVTGRGRYDEVRAWEAPREVSVHQLRLLAARARCDVLVVFDYGYRVERSPNGYAAFNALLIPALFTPFVDARVESSLEAFVLDVRNGYLYRHLTTTQRGEVERLTVWSDDDQRLLEAQWNTLLADTRRSLTAALDEGRAPEPSPDAAP